MPKGVIKLDVEAMKPLLADGGLTWSGLARAAGVTPNVVIRAAKDGRKIMPQTARKLAKALGKKTHEIAVLC